MAKHSSPPPPACGPWPPSLSSSNPVDLGFSLANSGCSSSRGPPPHYPVFSWLSLFLPAVDFFIQNLFRHTLIIHIVHMTPPADPPSFDKSGNVNMAQDGFDFVTWSQSPFSTQWAMSTDSSDHVSLKDSQGLFICSFQGLDLSSIRYHRSYEHFVQCHVTSLTEKVWPLQLPQVKICTIPCHYSLGDFFHLPRFHCLY